jgi:hypothetical protein
MRVYLEYSFDRWISKHFAGVHAPDTIDISVEKMGGLVDFLPDLYAKEGSEK